jgi:hypothetical protein
VDEKAFKRGQTTGQMHRFATKRNLQSNAANSKQKMKRRWCINYEGILINAHFADA